MLSRDAFRIGFAVVLLVTMLAGDAVRYSLTWYGFGAIVAALAVSSVMLLVRHRERLRAGMVPLPLWLFLGWAVASLAWSAYPGPTALGVLATALTTLAALALAVSLDERELLRVLGWVLRTILGLSILFELFVSAVVRQPVLPLWVTYPPGELPQMLYWSRNVLFEGGKIQGIVGNSSLLAFVALLGVIVFAVQLAARTVSRAGGAVWLALALVTIVLTRSATIYAGLAALAVTVVVIVLLRRTRSRRGRVTVYGVLAAVVAGGVAAALLAGDRLLALVGKSSDLTGRAGIWEAVIGLAEQKPVIGWGWVSYWVPWAEPFDDLVIRNGVVQLHAHNAWLDVWMQLGAIGLALFAALVAVTVWRSWRRAASPGPDAGLRLLPLLLLVALLVQSLAESRLLVEYGWLLLVVIAVTSKRHARVVEAGR